MKLHGLALVSLLLIASVVGSGDRVQATEGGDTTCANGQDHRAPQGSPQSVDASAGYLQAVTSNSNTQITRPAKAIARPAVFHDAAGNEYRVLRRGDPLPEVDVWYIYEDQLGGQSTEPVETPRKNDDNRLTPRPIEPRTVYYEPQPRIVFG